MMTSLLDQLVAVSVYHLQTWVSNALKCSRILQLNSMELALGVPSSYIPRLIREFPQNSTFRNTHLASRLFSTEMGNLFRTTSPCRSSPSLANPKPSKPWRSNQSNEEMAIQHLNHNFRHFKAFKDKKESCLVALACLASFTISIFLLQKMQC